MMHRWHRILDMSLFITQFPSGRMCLVPSSWQPPTCSLHGTTSLSLPHSSGPQGHLMERQHIHFTIHFTIIRYKERKVTQLLSGGARIGNCAWLESPLFLTTVLSSTALLPDLGNLELENVETKSVQKLQTWRGTMMKAGWAARVWAVMLTPRGKRCRGTERSRKVMRNAGRV